MNSTRVIKAYVDRFLEVIDAMEFLAGDQFGMIESSVPDRYPIDNNNKGYMLRAPITQYCETAVPMNPILKNELVSAHYFCKNYEVVEDMCNITIEGMCLVYDENKEHIIASTELCETVSLEIRRCFDNETFMF